MSSASSAGKTQADVRYSTFTMSEQSRSRMVGTLIIDTIRWSKIGQSLAILQGHLKVMQTICVHIARFILAHWKEIDGESLMDCSDIDVEPQLKQMMRPLSIVLQIFPMAKEQFRKYMLEQ